MAERRLTYIDHKTGEVRPPTVTGQPQATAVMPQPTGQGMPQVWGGLQYIPYHLTDESGQDIEALWDTKSNNVIQGQDVLGTVNPDTGAFIPPQPSLMESVSKTTSKWWEKPAEWAEQGMTAVGEGMANVPILPQALQFAAPAFEFITEKLEKPWSAMLLSSLSPEIERKEGESWLDWEKRQYEAWDAPTYLKGAAEFAMPLWWIPWLGWGLKGAKSMAVATRLMKADKLFPKAAENIVFPLYTDMAANVSDDWMRKAAHRIASMPLLDKAIKAVGGVSALMKKVAVTPEEKALQYVVFKAFHLDMGQSLVATKLRRLYKLAITPFDEAKILKLEGSKVGAATVDATHPGVKVGEKVSYELDDVITHPQLYLLPEDAASYINVAREQIGFFERVAAVNGVKIPKRSLFDKDFNYIPRIVESVERGKGPELIKHMNPFEQTVYDTALEGVGGGVKYATGIAARVQLYGNAITRRIANQHFDNMTKHLGKSVIDMIAEVAPEIAGNLAMHTSRVGVIQKAIAGLKTALPLKGMAKPVRGDLINTVHNEFPELAAKMTELNMVKPQSIIDYIGKMSKATQKLMGVENKEIVSALKLLPPKATLDDALAILTKYSANEAKAIRFYERWLKQSATAELAEYKRVAAELLDETKGLLALEKPMLKSVKKEMAALTKKYSVPELGSFEAVIKRHPAFAGRIFPKEVQAIVERDLLDEGNKFLKGASKVSGMGRTLKAALDWSAPFIQGLPIFGRNPLAWGKAYAGMVRGTFDPKWMYSELVRREASVIDRIMHGGSTSAIDIFEAIPGLRKGAGKLFGRAGERAVTGTYGRAELAFLGFSELARDEMWKAGKAMIMKRGLSEVALNKQLDDYARTLDRMTGVMSTRALGLGATQKQFESAFGFFTPRYTRAVLAFMGDAIKGGITGAETRKALAGMMGGGVAVYMATTSAMNQQPNFDPTSAKFMTIKVGNNYVGVGGLFYSVMRLMANTVAVAGDDITKLSPTNLSRVDNPFYKFLYARTSVLTGLLSQAIEQKDYMGRPIEGTAGWAAFLAEKVTPIFAQQLVQSIDREEWEKEPFEPMGTAAEFGGLRTFPVGEWNKLKEMRSDYSMKDFGKPYDELNTEERDTLRQSHQDYKEFDEEAREHITLSTGDDFELLMFHAQKKANATFYYQGETLANALTTGQITYRDYLDEVSNNKKYWQGQKSVINGVKDIADPQTYRDFQKWLDNQPAEDKVLQRYWDLTRQVNRDPNTGLLDWDTREAKINDYLDTLSQSERDYIDRNKNRNLLNYPPQFQAIERLQADGRDIVNEYYTVTDKQRTQYRRSNPNVDAWLLLMGRVTVPQTRMARQIAIDELKSRDLPLTMIPRLTEGAVTTPMVAQGQPRRMIYRKLT